MKNILVAAVGLSIMSALPAMALQGEKDTSPQLLQSLIASDERPPSQRVRDQYRHPFETLTFFDLKPNMNVVEIFPGGQGGWYRRIIEPFIEAGGGSYYPVRGGRGWPGNQVEAIPYGAIDMALVFRVHGFLIYGYPAQDHLDDLYRMVKPGGYFGIVDHAGNEAVEQDPSGRNGYVNESYFQAMAEKAGFVLVKTSDVNRNPADTKDYPRGLYSLPPTLSGPDKGKHRSIGESDRFTHLYQKPQ